ncbi:MAG: fumarate hydratase [Planctomycetes bacterium]|nr:fumarate hydratase [Planctomycetota bacterium]
MAAFEYHPIVQRGPDTTEYRSLTSDHVTVEGDVLRVEPAALELLAFHAFDDITHLLRSDHLAQLRKILDDPEASNNDRFVALELLKNANIAAGRELPGCQDTGTAIVTGWKGERVRTGIEDAEALSKGIYRTYQERNLRFSQMAPLDMYTEQNTKTNLPAQIEIYSKPGDEYRFLFIAKGGGSANKTFLYQQTKALLNEESLERFIIEKIQSIGTSACPPYHLALVIGGTSAEFTLKTVKLASCHFLDDLPTSGDPAGRAFRDLGMEEKVFELCQKTGIGAQFGGKYFAHDVRVIRLPRHGASCPVGLGVSCSADRQAKGKITKDGVFLEQLETNPARFLPDIEAAELDGAVVSIDLGRPMDEIRAELTKHPVGTRLSLSGPLVVARDIAHARLQEAVDRGEPLPDALKTQAVYYAGPAKTPEGLPSGSFGPTTAGRMDPYVDGFQALGGSMVMLAKGNRSQQVTDACARHGGFYLGSIGGPAAHLAHHSIKNVEVLMFEELGMEAIWSIDIADFPAFIVVDDKGNDFYAQINARRSAQIDV